MRRRKQYVKVTNERILADFRTNERILLGKRKTICEENKRNMGANLYKIYTLPAAIVHCTW